MRATKLINDATIISIECMLLFFQRKMDEITNLIDFLLFVVKYFRRPRDEEANGKPLIQLSIWSGTLNIWIRYTCVIDRINTKYFPFDLLFGFS